MRCDGCKHWKKDSANQEWEAEKAGFGECLAVRARWRIMDEAKGALDSDRWGDDAAEARWLAARTDALKLARAYVQDGSEYRAELFTAPDFFCALHSINEVTP